MELECAKYKEKMDSEKAHCAHPGDYCKYRTSCIIHFMGSEREDDMPAVGCATDKSSDTRDRRQVR